MNRLIDSFIGLLARLPYPPIALLGRLSVGLVFWNSGRSKVDGWNIFQVSDKTLFLFSDEYRLFRLFGKQELWTMPPWTAALAAQIAEHVLGALLIAGLASRFSALGLFIMTLIIEVFVYPQAYVMHGTWAAILLMLVKFGPGALSLDHLIRRR